MSKEIAVPSPDAPAVSVASVTPSDATALDPIPRALYIGATGDVAVITPDGATATFVGVPTGAIIPVRAKYVKTTGTTATSIVAMI